MQRLHFRVEQSIQAEGGDWYQNVQWLGTGGNSTAFLVHSTSGLQKGNLFALKVFQKLSAKDRRDKFLEEISFLKECCHTSIMNAYDSGVFSVRSNGEDMIFPFVVTEYLPMTLEMVIRADHANVVEKLSFSMQLLSALRYLNDLTPQVVHRDIKPSNIFVKGRSCILGDFGLMKVLDNPDIEADREAIRESGGAGMPFFYRTPDLLRYVANEAPLTTKSDVYQLGLVLAELFSGSNPQKPANDITDPIQMERIDYIPGKYGTRIFNILRDMLKDNPAERPECDMLLDRFSGVFSEVVNDCHSYQGKAF